MFQHYRSLKSVIDYISLDDSVVFFDEKIGIKNGAVGVFGRCKPLFENVFQSLLCLPSFLFSSFILLLHRMFFFCLSPTVSASIETARIYFSHMWTVDGKMSFTHSHDDERQWETGALLMLTAAVEDAAVNHFKYIKPSRAEPNAAPVPILHFSSLTKLLMTVNLQL